MKTIKIRSNPYRKEVLFYTVQEDGTSVEIKVDNGDSKLREAGADKIFLPFRISEIIDIISKEYYVPGGEKVNLIFEGTSDEYKEVENVCDDEDYVDKIELVRSEEYLEDARDILKNTKEIFREVEPILDNFIGDDDAIKKNLCKVSDAMDDIIPICVFGNYSAGKSTFINALIGYEVLPSGGDPVTAKVFKITRSSQEDRIEIGFTYKDEEYVLKFDEDEHRVVKGSKDSEIVRSINENIEKLENKNIFMKASATLEIINNFEKNDSTEIEIGDVVCLEVPFSKKGVLGQSLNKFVIFDTPGSNSNSNRDHADILRNALEGFSNGIPVWVSIYESIDSIDNANLCDIIYDIEALDKRFNMIVVNKADAAELPENGIDEKEARKILEYDAIEKMYSSGIFFVSSIMGLGAKNDANFINKFMKKTFKEKKDSFSNPEDIEFYQCLYKYNIMPSQIKEQAMEDSLNNKNLIYANSGVFCVENEMEKFATRFSSYNKCQMVHNFLNSVIDKTNNKIEEEKNTFNGYKEQERSKLNEKEIILKKTICDYIDNKSEELYNKSKNFAKTYVNENIKYDKKVEDLEEKGDRYTHSNELKSNYSSYELEYKQSQDKMWGNVKKNIKGFTKGKVKFRDIINTWFADREEYVENKDAMEEKRKEIDRTTSDVLISEVREEYKKNILEGKNSVDEAIKIHWKDNAETFKKELITIITGNENLSVEERNEISSIILKYDALEFDDEVDEAFVKTKFLIWNTERINNKKLTSNYNNTIIKKLTGFAKYRNDKCKDSFEIWANSLHSVIEQNLTEYNPELKEIESKMKSLSNRIKKLERDQVKILNSIDAIGGLMVWKNDDEDDDDLGADIEY